jgi:monofunctional glycosyltransferase
MRTARYSPRRLFLLLLSGIAAGLAASILWVGLYRFVDPPGTLLMLIRQQEGTPLIRQSQVPLNRIAPSLVQSVIAAEDSRFCSHGGIDWQAIQAARLRNERGRSLRGASTISMQVAKNAFLWPDRTWLRKGAELWFTLWLELLWPKQRVIEVYLNIAEWGDGVFGAEAAARHWFNKPAASLTALESARLAAVLPNPRSWNPARPGGYVNSRTQLIQQRAAEVRRQGLDDCVR